jgi:ABC-type glycerol-3-phosphate transport system substrate-binding protein
VPENGDPLVFAYLFGGQLVDNLTAPTRPTLDTPTNVKAVEWYTNLRRLYNAMPEPGAISGREIYRWIIEGRCGMWLGFYSDRARYYQRFNTHGGALPGMLPLPAGDAQFGVIRLDAYVILKDSKHADTVWKWLLFLLDQQDAAKPMLPARVSQYRSGAGAGQEAAAVGAKLPSQIFVWDNRLQTSKLGGSAAAFIAAVEEVLSGAADPAAALTTAQAKAEALFAASE